MFIKYNKVLSEVDKPIIISFKTTVTCSILKVYVDIYRGHNNNSNNLNLKQLCFSSRAGFDQVFNKK